MNALDGAILEYTNVEFPVMLKDIRKVEKQNKINVNVFGLGNNLAFQIYISKGKHKKVMNLLYKNHYVLINNFNRFMYSYTKHFCMYCLQCFHGEHTLEKHKNNCKW